MVRKRHILFYALKKSLCALVNRANQKEGGLSPRPWGNDFLRTLERQLDQAGQAEVIRDLIN